MNGASRHSGRVLASLPGVVALVALAATRLHSYALFHSLSALYIIAVEFSLFAVVWNSRRLLDDGALMLIGVSAGAVAVVDAVHLLVHHGSALAAQVDAAAPLRLWIGGRTLQAASLLIASRLGRRRPVPWVVLLASSAAAVVIIGSVFSGVLPRWILSPADSSSAIAAEALVVATLAFALYGIWTRATTLRPATDRLLLWSAASLLLSELVLAASPATSAIGGLIGHLLRIAGTYALYRAVVVSVLEEPHAVMFREMTLRNARLEEAERALRRAKDRSDAMTVISSMIARAADLDAIITRALELGCKTLGADGAALSARDGARLVVTHAHGFDRSVMDISGGPRTSRHMHLAIEKRAPVIVNDPLHDPRVDSRFVARFGITALLAAPLVVGDEVLGAVTFVIRKGRGAFDENARSFAGRLATALGLAIANERLRTSQARVADALRSAILTMPDRLPGILVGHAYRSADRLARIGGDFYDAFQIAPGRHAILMGDVSGKGVDAAVSSFVTRTAFHALALLEDSPSGVMTAANRVLARLLPDEAFATAIFGVLDTATGVFTACSAGHPDPLVCVQGACIEHDAIRSLPLGMFPDARYEEFTIPLKPDHVLVLFSDGVIDARRGNDPFGEARVRDTLRSAGTGDPQRIADVLLAGVSAHADGCYLDDIAILALRLEQGVEDFPGASNGTGG